MQRRDRAQHPYAAGRAFGGGLVLPSMRFADLGFEYDPPLAARGYRELSLSGHAATGINASRITAAARCRHLVGASFVYVSSAGVCEALCEGQRPLELDFQ